MNLLSLSAIVAFCIGILLIKRNRALAYAFGGIGFVLLVVIALLGVL